MRETIGWIEQEPGNGKAFFCWHDKNGSKVEWELVELRCRPDPNGSGIEHPQPIRIAA